MSYVLTALMALSIFLGVDVVAMRRSAVDLRQHFWRFPDGDPSALRVEVTAQQWAWNFRYCRPRRPVQHRRRRRDAQRAAHARRRRPIYLKLRSKDVVHSFYLPNFRTKIDAVPGNTTRLWFQAREPGDFEIGCAQHCGVSHYKMRAQLSATSAEDDNAPGWRAPPTDSALRYDAGPPPTRHRAAGTGTADGRR